MARTGRRACSYVLLDFLCMESKHSILFKKKKKPDNSAAQFDLKHYILRQILAAVSSSGSSDYKESRNKIQETGAFSV